MPKLWFSENARALNASFDELSDIKIFLTRFVIKILSSFNLNINNFLNTIQRYPFQFMSIRGVRVQYANEIPVNIYPQVKRTYGALIQLSKSITDLTIEDENIYQVTITAKNVGDSAAYSVDIDDNYPMDNFTIISGTNSITWDFIPPNLQFSYSYVVNYPETIDSSIQVSYVTASYNFAYNWYSGSSWEGTYDFNPLSGSAQGVDGFLPFVLGIGFLVSTVAAVALGVLLLREKEMI